VSSPKDYRCLTCNARPGEPCKRPSGHTIPFGGYHAGRKEMWSFFNSPGYGAAKDEDLGEPQRAQETMF
jgi:hypothetical protein